jgi:tetratricopeptide (TPR) repeat protein
MPDLSKHLARAKQALERRQYDLAIEICWECVDIAPDQLDFHSLHLDAARRKAKESGRKSLIPSLGGLSFTKDPHKQLVIAFKKVSSNVDNKSLAELGDASLKLSYTLKSMSDIAIYYYEEIRKSGMFNDKVLWNLGHVYYEKFKEVNKTNKPESKPWLEKAILVMTELEKAMPQHNEAPKMVKNWEALRSMERRNEGNSTDYRSQLASDDKSKRAEVMNRLIRTVEDAKEVLGYVESDLKANPKDKALWVKKADVHQRLGQLDLAKAALDAAQALDVHDFTVTMKLGDLGMREAEVKIELAKKAGQDTAVAEKEFLVVKTEEYRRRVERQPTDMSHRYNLGTTLLKAGQIDAAAAEFQRTVNDAKHRRSSHRFLGYCFTQKNLLDLASGQYAAYLQLVEDEQAEEPKNVRYSLARVLERLGKKTEAIEVFEKLVAVDLSYRDAAERLSKLRGEFQSEHPAEDPNDPHDTSTP